MKSRLLSAVVIGASLLPIAAFAKRAHAPTSVECPVCHMQMSNKKSANAPVRVKVNGHRYYCCAGCGFAPTKHKKKM